MNKAVGTTFSAQGFLSDYMHVWSARHRDRFSSTFGMADKLNGIAHKILSVEHPVPSDGSGLLSHIYALLFLRCLSNFQSCIILLRNGLNQDARILARSCLETTFMLGAAYRMGEGFVERLLAGHNRARSQIGLGIQDIDEKKNLLSEEQKREVDDTVRKYLSGDRRDFNFREIAEIADMGELYNLYKMLSNFAAHPTLDSLPYHFVEQTGDLKFEPDEDEDSLFGVIELASGFLFTSCSLFNEHIAKSSELAADLQNISAEFDRWRSTVLRQ